jgi:peptidoglycan/LPS O-acetylase OafA/YrhL
VPDGSTFVQAERAKPDNRVGAIDGVRALAIAVVIAYHADLEAFPGGFLGVEMFFVLSGYLVGGALISELGRRDRIDAKRYAIRRIQRLAPALITMLAVVGATVLLGYRDEVDHLRRGALGAVTGTGNWLELASGGDYFAAFGRGPVLRHLWSFSVEVQAYALLPLLLWVLWVATDRHKEQIAGVLIVLVTASYTWQTIVAHHGATSSRAYFGTDTRIGAVLLGAALACLGQSTIRTYLSTTALTLAGWISLASLAILVALVEGTDPHLYNGILALTAILSAVVIAAAANSDAVGQTALFTGAPGQVCRSGESTGRSGHVVGAVALFRGSLNRFLGCAPLRWLGTRSYGMYLWHWPIFVLTRPIAGIPMPVLPFTVRVGLTALLAEGSFRYVETMASRASKREPWSRRRLGELAASALAGCLVFGIATATPARSSSSLTNLLDAQLIGISAEETSPPETLYPAPYNSSSTPSNTPPHTVSSTTSSTAPPSVASAPPDMQVTTTTAAAPLAVGNEITMIGDSLMETATSALQAKFGTRIVVDTQVGRQFTTGIERANALRYDGKLKPIVVIGLGTNGPFSEKQIEALIAELSDRKTIAFVKVVVPRRWQNTVNEALEKAKERHPELVLIDWPTWVEDYKVRLQDGVHPTARGARLYADLIADTLATQTVLLP